MGYRKIKPVLLHVDTLYQECGLFTCDTDLNGGYGCLSRSKDKSEPKRCYGFDCPLAYQPSLAELKKHDKDIYDQWKETVQGKYKGYGWEYKESKEDDYMPNDFGCEWLIQYRECV